MSHPDLFRLLMVEDNPGDADLARVYLEQVPGYRFELTVVPALRQAIEAIHSGDFDAVVLDLNLPDSQGLETLRRFHREHPDIPVVVVSGFSDDDLRQAALDEGAGDFISKSEPPTTALARSIRYAVERHRAHDRQRHSEMLVAANPFAVVVGDAEGVVQFVNQAAEELFGKPAAALVGEHHQFLAAGEHVEELHIPRSGGERTAEVRSVEVEWNGEPAVLAALHDITERLRLGEQLRQAQKMEALGRLAGGIVHDFNNLLAAISGYTELIVAGLDDRPDLLDDAQQLLSATQRAAEMTRQLLAFSRQQPVAAARIDINSVVQDLWRMLDRLVGDDINVRLRLHRDALVVVCDHGQISQVLLNLVVNARDAMDSGGTIAISTTIEEDEPAGDGQPGRSAVLRVSDTGSGMDAAILDRIFEPFFTTKGPGEGTGLGLATAYGVVSQAGGRIDVESTPGEGTTFTVRLPLEAAPAQISGSSLPLDANGETSGTVLVIEDQDDVRRVTERLLASFGYSVLTLQRPEMVADLSAGVLDSIDLLLTDVSMPALSGPQIASALRRRRPELPVLYMSGYSSQPLEDQYGLAGQVILRKPFKSAELLAAVRAALAPRP